MKLCMIGSRGHCAYVFESIAEVPDVTVTAVSPGCEDDPSRLLAMSERAGFHPELHGDWRTMLDKAAPDVVCIDGPFDKHAEMCIEALRRNIHVFCEKPIALTLEDLDRIQQAHAGSSARIVSMVGLRYDPAFYQAARMVHEGAVGKVKLIRAQKSYKLGTRPDFYRKREDVRRNHSVGRQPCARLDSLFHAGHLPQRDRGADRGGQSGQRRSGNCRALPVCHEKRHSGLGEHRLSASGLGVHARGRPRPGGRTDGVLEVANGKITLIDAGGERSFTPETPDRKLFSDFILELEGGRPAIVSDAETFELTRACLLAREAADTGKQVLF